MAEAGFAVNDAGCWVLSGTLDYGTVASVADHRGATLVRGNDIRVDLSQVTRVDSAGLALMVAWLAESERAGLAMTFENVPEQLRSIAHVCGLEDILSL